LIFASIQYWQIYRTTWSFMFNTTGYTTLSFPWWFTAASLWSICQNYRYWFIVLPIELKTTEQRHHLVSLFLSSTRIVYCIFSMISYPTEKINLKFLKLKRSIKSFNSLYIFYWNVKASAILEKERMDVKTWCEVNHRFPK